MKPFKVSNKNANLLFYGCIFMATALGASFSANETVKDFFPATFLLFLFFFIGIGMFVKAATHIFEDAINYLAQSAQHAPEYHKTHQTGKDDHIDDLDPDCRNGGTRLSER